MRKQRRIEVLVPFYVFLSRTREKESKDKMMVAFDGEIRTRRNTKEEYISVFVCKIVRTGHKCNVQRLSGALRCAVPVDVCCVFSR